MNNGLIAHIRTKYHSGLYSNTELVIEFAPLLGALQLISILNYSIKPEICKELKDRILVMEDVHTLLSAYHKTLRIGYTIAEDSEMDGEWRVKEYNKAKLGAQRDLTKGLKVYPWVTSDFLSKAYHE